MSWEPVTPGVRTSGRPMVTARLAVKKDGTVSLTLFLSDFLVREFGEPKAVNAMVGTGDDAGRLRLVFGPEGTFKVGQSAKAWRVTLPCAAFGGKPGALAPAAVVVKNIAAGELVLEMPVEAWAGSAIAAARVLNAAAPGPATGGGLGWSQPGPVALEPAERRRLSAPEGPQGRGAGRRAIAGGRQRDDPRPGAGRHQPAARRGQSAAAVACGSGVRAG